MEGAVGADTRRGVWLAAHQSEERSAAVTGDRRRGPLCSCVTAAHCINCVCTIVPQTSTLEKQNVLHQPCAIFGIVEYLDAILHSVPSYITHRKAYQPCSCWILYMY